MRAAWIFGGAGATGRALARRLLDRGWRVAITGRDSSHVPEDLLARGVTFHALDRRDAHALRRVFAGCDLLVDCLCFSASDARMLVPYLDDVASTVMLSSRAVYVDAAGHHVNGDVPPRFPVQVRESQPTVDPVDSDPFTREGYAPNKVAAERVLLARGAHVAILRVAKIHGEGANPPRTWSYVKRALERRPIVLLPRQGRDIDHLLAATNLARLIERLADGPHRGIFNAGDPDAPTLRAITQAIASRVGHTWREVLLDDALPASLDRPPFEALHPFVLDTSAANATGYVPAGNTLETLHGEIDWLVTNARRASDGRYELPPSIRVRDESFDDDLEDAFVASMDRRA